ncbi:MAG: RagB/SusD family nutrient uptake outer membrane protein [Candidatus Cryptobacteroides sp.]
MKKFLTIFAVGTLALSLVSCDKFFDVKSPSAADDAAVFSDYTLTEYAVFGIHESYGMVNCYRGRYLPWYGFNTDIEWYNGTNSAGKEITQYAITTTNSQLNLSNGPFNVMYEAIEKANLIIEGLNKYGNCDSDSDMGFLLGEALCLRAMTYFDLIKAWGDVPARFEPITTETIYMAKSNRDEIYKQILKDLERAIVLLPYPGEGRAVSTVRASKTFAEGLYARIALSASGYALRVPDGQEGTGNAGEIRLSNDPELSKDVLYPKALEYLTDAIDSRANSLEQDYEGMWYNMNNLDTTPGRETIYSFPFDDNRGRWNFTFAGLSDASSISSYVKRGGEGGPVPTLWFDYDPDDIRRDISCINFKWNKDDSIEPAGIDTWYFGKYRYNWMKVQPYGGGNDDGVKPVVLRYSDILLMAAEIENELGNLDAAKSHLLEVRSRAFAGNESKANEYVNAINSKDMMFEAIVKERAFEFVGEFLRKQDLIRWNLLGEKMEETIKKMEKLSALTEDYSYLQNTIYFQYAEDGESIIIYGFGQNETENPGKGWEAVDNYFTDAKGKAKFDLSKKVLYQNEPDQWMYWPIFDNSLTNSQGFLKNDFGF